jgi:hypothetical protein
MITSSADRSKRSPAAMVFRIASTILNPATANNYLEKKPPLVLGRDFHIRWQKDGRATLIVPHLKA